MAFTQNCKIFISVTKSNKKGKSSMTLDKKWRDPNEEEKQEIVNQMKTYWKSLCLIMAIAEIFYICKFISKAQVALKNNDIATMFVTILTIIISIVWRLVWMRFPNRFTGRMPSSISTLLTIWQSIRQSV